MRKLIVCFLLIFAVNLQAFAALKLQLIQGDSDALSIAIMPFSVPAVLAPGNLPISTIIQNDLEQSGEFGVESNDVPTIALNQPIDVLAWEKLSVSAIVRGSIKAKSGHQYQVRFQLLKLPQTQGTDSVSTLLDKTFTIDQSNLRELAHYISDNIYYQLTGVQGLFSTRLAYVAVTKINDLAHYSLNVCDSDGFNANPIFKSNKPILSPAWAPNGQAIAYVSIDGAQSVIYLQHLATGKREILYKSVGMNDALSFSPNGKQLAFASTKNGMPNIYIMDLTTHHMLPITDDHAINTEPSWTPNGQAILFTSNRGGSPQIYQYNISTKTITRLTFNGNYNATSSMLPNKDGFIFLHGNVGMFNLAKQTLASGAIDLLTDSKNDQSPSLSPNGKMIIYTTAYAHQRIVAIVSTDSRIKLRFLTTNPNENILFPAWSPFLEKQAKVSA